VEVRNNSFTSLSVEDKAKRINQLRNGNPNWKAGKSGNPKGAPTKAINDRKKLFSEVLREIYTGKGGPKRLKKLAIVCIEYAEAGHARFAELILDRLEGPVKHEPSVVNNLNIFSEADRQRAISVVDDILAMDAKTIVLPQLSQENSHDLATAGPEGVSGEISSSAGDDGIPAT
jgi:hypothetical protein